MIDIIIPAYNSHDTLEQTLSSIAYQDNVEKLKVYVVNDGSSIDYCELISFFSNFLDIKELKLEKNSGPGVARQYGIDNSNSEFIVFIDSDDVFSDCYAVQNLFDAINETDYDVVVSEFVEETPNGFFNKKKDFIWLHGKIYRRKFLENNSIKFNDSRANEDNGFNQLIMLNNAKINYITSKTYVWRNNINSITRSNNYEYRYKGIMGYIYNITWALNSAIANDCSKEKIADLAFLSLVSLYCNYLEFSDKIDLKDFIKCINPLRNISIKYSVDEERRINLLESQYSYMYGRMNKKYLLNPKISFSVFLNLIDKEQL